jgi:hypothetical protein
MDAVSREEVTGARVALETAIAKAGLEADPVAEMLRAMSQALDTQKRMHDSTVEHLTGMSVRLDRQYDDTMAQAERCSPPSAWRSPRAWCRKWPRW